MQKRCGPLGLDKKVAVNELQVKQARLGEYPGEASEPEPLACPFSLDCPRIVRELPPNWSNSSQLG